MAKQAVAVLESALRAHKLDRTLTSALPSLDRPQADATVATAVAALDASLRGGLPRGQVSELAGAASSGRTTLLLQLMAAATRRGELIALVDSCDRFDVASAVAAGVDLDRVLWIRGQAITRASAGPAGTSTLVERTLTRALKALMLVLQAGGFDLVALDLADAPAVALKQLPFTTWLRVQRTIEGSDTACVLLVPAPLGRSAGGLTLSLSGRSAWEGTAGRSRRLTGMDLQVRVISPRRRDARDVIVGCRMDTSSGSIHDGSVSAGRASDPPCAARARWASP